MAPSSTHSSDRASSSNEGSEDHFISGDALDHSMLHSISAKALWEKQQYSTRQPSYLMFLLYSLLVIMSVSQCLSVWEYFKTKPLPEYLGEVHGLLPDFGARVREFQVDKERAKNVLNASDPSWTSIMPMGLGFIHAKNWETHQDTLPPAIRVAGKDVFSVAVFHQIHCLHYLLEQFNKLDDAYHNVDAAYYKLLATKKLNSRTKTGHEGGEEAREHVGHCFDYLRSSLVCCGDTAFEGQASDTIRPSTLGEGSHHVCKNYDMIKKWAETSRISNQKEYEDS